MANTISGLMTLAPVLGGWLLEASSYTALFAITAAVVSVGFVLTFWLRPLRPDSPMSAPASDGLCPQPQTKEAGPGHGQ
jgi:hypothetical protein